MNAERLLQHYHRIGDAPDAIARLRRFILDLAVRGKLVPQDPNDESALELLGRIAAEKLQLVKTRAIRPENKPKPADPRGLPFNIKPGWQAATIEQILIELQTGPFGSSLHQSDYRVGGVPVVNPASIQNEQIIPIERMAVGTATLERLSTFKLRVGDIVMGRRGEMGRCAVVTEREAGWLCGTGSLILRLPKSVFGRFFVLLIGSPYVRNYLGASAVGATMQNLNQGILLNLVIGLPPHAEQGRIVTKVDELMALCDRLEAARAERETKRDRLAAASLARLNAPDPDTFQDDTRFALATLPALTTRPDQIKQLRQTILNLAVRGKLVRQNLHDEPASELLKRLKEARSLLEAAGRIRKEKGDAPSHYGGEQNFELPRTWAWARLLEIGQTQTGTSPSSGNPDLFGNFIPFIKPADLDGNQIDYDGPGLSESGIKHSRLAAANSILMVCIATTLGKVNTTSRPVCFNQQINSLTPFLDGLTSFVALALKASEFQALAWSKAGTGTLPIISKGKWEQLPIPIPPLAEQHRIVAKVDELMALCDRIEASLDTASTTRRRLLDALLAEALAPVEPREMEAAE